MKIGLIFCLILISFNKIQASPTLKPFKTDFCTGYVEGTIGEPSKWKHCCVVHDMFLWAGGDKQDRFVSDLFLRDCVAETGEHEQAFIIYWAVRVSSLSPIKLPEKAWSNGWPNTRPKFQPLNASEIDLIENEISQGYLEIPQELKNYFVQQLRSRLE